MRETQAPPLLTSHFLPCMNPFFFSSTVTQRRSADAAGVCCSQGWIAKRDRDGKQRNLLATGWGGAFCSMCSPELSLCAHECTWHTSVLTPVDRLGFSLPPPPQGSASFLPAKELVRLQQTIAGMIHRKADDIEQGGMGGDGDSG